MYKFYVIEYGAVGIPLPELDHIDLHHPMIHLKPVSIIFVLSSVLYYIYKSLNLSKYYIVYVYIYEFCV